LILQSATTAFFARVLGQDAPPLIILLCAILAANSFFYLYSLASYFGPTTWLLVDRISYYGPFDQFVISKNIDHLIIISSTLIWLVFSIRSKIKFTIATLYGVTTAIIALSNQYAFLDIVVILSIPIIITLLLVNTFSRNKFLISDRNLVINYLALMGIAMGIAAIISSLVSIYLSEQGSNVMRNFAHEIYLIFSTFSPILLILLILSFPVKLVSDLIVQSLLTMRKGMHYIVLSTHTMKPLTKLFLLLLFMGLSASMVIIPHLKEINIDNKDVGVDTHYYVQWNGILLNSTNAGELLNQAFAIVQHGDRPFSLLFLLMISQLVPSDNLSYLFEQVPILLGAALILVIYFLTRELTSNDIASLLSAFLTAVSFHTLIGIYAGAYANWLELIVGYLTIIFLLRSLKDANKLNTGLFFGLLVTLLFTHIYTWSILILVMGVFLLVLLKLHYYDRKKIILLLVVLSCSLLIDVGRMIITGAYSGIGYDISPPFGSDLKLGPEQFMTRWSSLIDTTQNYYGSLFANSIIYGLGLYWLLRSRVKDLHTIFLITFLSIGIIPLFLGNWSVQSRVFYDVSFQIPAGIALAYIYKKSNGPFIILPICIWLVAMAIIAVSNFYLVSTP
jgi:hypothetical protein